MKRISTKYGGNSIEAHNFGKEYFDRKVIDRDWFTTRWVDKYNFEREWFHKKWTHRQKFGRY